MKHNVGKRWAPYAFAACLLSLAAGPLSHAADTAKPALKAVSTPVEADWTKVVAAAEAEGKVTFYSSDVEAVNAAIIKLFKQKYPKISVEYLRLPTDPLVTRLMQEQGAGFNVADVLRVGDPDLPFARPDMFIELTPTVLPMLSEYPKTAWVYPWDVATQTSLFGINYNNTMISAADVPKTWPELLNDKWKHKIVLSDPRAAGSNIAWHELMKRAHGIDYVKRFAKMDWTLIDGSGPGAQQVAAGAYEMSLPAQPGHAMAVINAGAPVSYVILSDPTMAQRDNLMILAKAPHPNAARVFANFRLSQAAQAAMCKQNVLAATLPGVPGCFDLSSRKDVMYTKDMWTPAEKKEYLDILGIK